MSGVEASNKQELHRFCHVDGRKFANYERVCPRCGTSRLVALDTETSAAFNAPAVTSQKRTNRNQEKQLNVNIQHYLSVSLLLAAWRKVLYEQQDALSYPDNYTDAHFMRGLIHNASFEPYVYWHLVRDSSVVSAECSATLLFVLLFVHTYQGALSPVPLVALACAFALPALGVVGGGGLARSVPLVLLVYGSVLSLAPVMRLLTDSFTDDTIWALVSALLALHLVFFAYGANADTNPMSLNAAIFASVLLGSRLASTAHVFGLISVAIQLFALFPLLRRNLRLHSPTAYMLLVWLLNLVVLALAVRVSTLLGALFAAALVAITFLSPMWLMSIQRYKNEINGPWDEARPIGAVPS
jgi:phosphatidylinositol glycan class C protein